MSSAMLEVMSDAYEEYNEAMESEYAEEYAMSEMESAYAMEEEIENMMEELGWK